MAFVIHAGNNLDVLPTLPDNSVDSIVTDPPYELGFMGKKWDNSGIAYSVELWTECLRVLKPGGHLLSFGGTRTWHRVAVAIEDAGFDVRDSIAWMYGSGFPKSLDVSKAIDKGTGENQNRQLKFVNWMRSTGLTAQDCDKILKAAGKISPTSSHSIHYFNEGQPQIATADTFDILKPHLPEVPEEIERLVAERTGIEWTAYKNRMVIGQRSGAQANSTGKFGGWGNDDGSGKSEYDETAPSTPEAEQWQGWGTALKPAFEPIVVARKPLIGTVAANVLEHGTGALNIDGSRIGIDLENEPNARPNAKNHSGHGSSFSVGGENNRNQDDLPDAGFHNSKGRWPANVILDEYSAGELDEQSGFSVTKRNEKPSAVKDEANTWGGTIQQNRGARGHSDSGGASRFFYCAKASKRDRNEGLEGLEARRASAMGYDIGLGEAGEGMFKDRNPMKQNFHPTVKPTNLMRYLVKLVTPPNGTVLDPFTGSGSTGKAAILEGFDFIGIELTEEYLPIIEGRLAYAEQMRLNHQQKKDEGLF